MISQEDLSRFCSQLRCDHVRGLKDSAGNHREFHEGMLAGLSAVEKYCSQHPKEAKENHMQFITITGSVYQVDAEQKLFRRLPRNNNPTKTEGDREWVKYALLTPLEVNKSATIWLEGNDLEKIRYIRTSTIERIEK
jgi:hypothetical protein